METFQQWNMLPFQVSKPRKSIIRLMHIELQHKRYYSIGEIAKAFDVNFIRFGTVNDILKPKKTLRKQDVYLKISKFATYLSSNCIRRSKIHLKEGQRRHWINLKLSGS
jgi:hypothetical protein